MAQQREQHAALRGKATNNTDWPSRYEQLLRIYNHRQAELRDQQARVASILTANGLILAFLAGRAAPSGSLGGLPLHSLYALALVLLSVAIVFSAAALWPLTPPSIPEFLDPAHVFAYESAAAVAEAVASWLKQALESEKWNEAPVRVLKFRRWLISAQLACIAAAALLVGLASLPGLV